MSITALIYLLLYVGGLAAALLKRPIYGLYVYSLSFYAYAPGRWWGSSLPDIRWAYIAALVTLVSIIIKKQEKIYFSFFENKLFIVFFLYVLLQTILIDSNNHHMIYVILLMKFVMLIFIIQNVIENEKDLINYILSNLIGCAYLGYLGYTMHTSGRLEAVGTPGLDSANQLAQHLGAVLVFSSFLLLIDIGKMKIIVIICLMFVLNAILLTESRGVLLALAATGIVSTSFIPSKSRKAFIPYLILGFVAASFLIGPQMIERMSSLNKADNVEELDKSAASRFDIISAQFEMFKDSPLFGYGHKGTMILSQDYISEEFLTTVNGSASRASHNVSMALLVDHGLIGAGIYFLIIFSCIKKGFRLSLIKDSKASDSLKLLFSGLVLSLLFFIVAGQTSNNKVLELDIWLYALIPLVYHWIKTNKDSKPGELNDN
ncbi:MAG: O-antigen ligase family protein [Pseudomonadota bacterium]